MGNICISNSTGLTSLVRNWTNVFAEKFKDLAPMCVLKFANYWLKKPNSRTRLIVLSSELERLVI